LPEKLPSVCQKNLEPISISVFQERKPYTKSQLGGHSGEFDEFDEFSVMTLLGASSDQKIMTGEMTAQLFLILEFGPTLISPLRQEVISLQITQFLGFVEFLELTVGADRRRAGVCEKCWCVNGQISLRVLHVLLQVSVVTLHWIHSVTGKCTP
jgi:hypothetical protein